MSESGRLDRLHELWTAEPTKYEAEFFAELQRSIAKAVSVITKKQADEDMVSAVLLHLVSVPRGKTEWRLSQYKPGGSFFSWVWEVTKRRRKDIRKKKAVYLVQVEDDAKLEEEREQYEVAHAPRKAGADCIEDPTTREIARGILRGEKLKMASEAVGLTANAGQLRLQQLRKRLTLKDLSESAERNEERKASNAWRSQLNVTLCIEADDPRLGEGWDKAA